MLQSGLVSHFVIFRQLINIFVWNRSFGWCYHVCKYECLAVSVFVTIAAPLAAPVRPIAAVPVGGVPLALHLHAAISRLQGIGVRIAAVVCATHKAFLRYQFVSY